MAFVNHNATAVSAVPAKQQLWIKFHADEQIQITPAVTTFAGRRLAFAVHAELAANVFKKLPMQTREYLAL